MSKRLFIGFKIPSGLKNELFLLQHKLRNNLLLEGVNWVKPENLHITVAFLGNVDEKMIPLIRDVLDTIDFSPIQTKGEALNFFIKNNNPSIFYYSLLQTEDLKNFVGKLRNRLILKNIDFDRKKFNAHITLARIKQPQSGQSLYQFVQKMDTFQPKEVILNSVCLFESRFFDGSTTYLSLYEIGKEV